MASTDGSSPISNWTASVAIFAASSALFAWRQRRADPSPDDTGDDAKDHVLALRQRFFSSAQSVSYLNTGPLLITKGRGCYLYDQASDTWYLDTRNNVAHCGHCHPHVVDAIQRQVAEVNTNTRYLHPTVCRLAERLVKDYFLADAPNLSKVFFCNSGSEANDLALRLLRARSRRQRALDRDSGDEPDTLIVVDRGYHGHTLASLAVSPYKYTTSLEYNPDDHDASAHWLEHDCRVVCVPSPDTFRGPHRGPTVASGAAYARYVEDACDQATARKSRVRGIIIESGQSVAGVIVPPPSYLRRVVHAVRKAGGLYIADEVQTGLGRCGRPWAWQLQSQGDSDAEVVVPDIVTMGKPMGNGMPLAAVVTTPAVAKSLEDCKVEYFNTFGGNPVCAAAGLAVLEVLENENLMAHADKVGSYLQEELRTLQKDISWIGDIRGRGLFVGVDFVRDRTTMEPATAEASWLCSNLKDKYHILTSIDGPHDNVLVIKPPMVFGVKEVDYLVKCIRQTFEVDLVGAGDLSNQARTPT